MGTTHALKSNSFVTTSTQLPQIAQSTKLSVLFTYKSLPETVPFNLLGFVESEKSWYIRLGSKLFIDYISGSTQISSIEFDVNILDGKWHKVGLSIDASTVTLYVDCKKVMSRNVGKLLFDSTSKNKILIEFGGVNKLTDARSGFMVSYTCLNDMLN